MVSARTLDARRYRGPVQPGDAPVSFVTRADGTVVISYHAAPVTDAAQQLMARATGKLKGGAERRGSRSRVGRRAAGLPAGWCAGGTLTVPSYATRFDFLLT